MKTSGTILLLLLLLVGNEVILAQTFDHISPKDNSNLFR